MWSSADGYHDALCLIVVENTRYRQCGRDFIRTRKQQSQTDNVHVASRRERLARCHHMSAANAALNPAAHYTSGVAWGITINDINPGMLVIDGTESMAQVPNIDQYTDDTTKRPQILGVKIQRFYRLHPSPSQKRISRPVSSHNPSLTPHYAKRGGHMLAKNVHASQVSKV